MMETRDPLQWHFKQLDHAMGLSFKANFNFALVGHLLKGLYYTLTVQSHFMYSVNGQQSTEK